MLSLSLLVVLMLLLIVLFVDVLLIDADPGLYILGELRFVWDVKIQFHVKLS